MFIHISFLELWQPLCSVEQNHLCNFSRGYHEEQFCEINFEFGPLVQEEMSFKRFLIKSWRVPHVQQSGTIYVILSISFLSRVYDMAGCFETQTVVMSFYVLKKINKMQAAG